MIDRDTIIYLLHRWGKWQRTAKKVNLSYAMSQHETPLQKQRNVTPIYKDSEAENMERLILKYIPKPYSAVLELTYVDKEINTVAADILKCSPKTFTIKRNEAISMLQGIYTVLQDKN